MKFLEGAIVTCRGIKWSNSCYSWPEIGNLEKETFRRRHLSPLLCKPALRLKVQESFISITTMHIFIHVFCFRYKKKECNFDDILY